MRAVYTTGQVARMCTVAPRTVMKWFDSGFLRGFRTPDRNERRIPRDCLIAFLREYHMPIGELLHTILIVGAEKSLTDCLRALIPEHDTLRYAHAKSGFEAGHLIKDLRPTIIIIDLGFSRQEALEIVTRLRRHPTHEQTVIIGLGSEDEATMESMTTYGFTRVLKKPFDVAILAKLIEETIQEREQAL
jgi:PleD family two-component response regulator